MTEQRTPPLRMYSNQMQVLGTRISELAVDLTHSIESGAPGAGHQQMLRQDKWDELQALGECVSAVARAARKCEL